MPITLETERTFFLRPRSELLREMLGEVSGAIRENIPVMEDLPVSGTKLAGYMLDDSFTLRQIAEGLLRKQFRFPEDIAEGHIVDETARREVERLLEELDQYTTRAVAGKLVNFHGQQIPPRFVVLYPPSGDYAEAVNITLNRYPQLPEPEKAGCVKSIMDVDAYRAGGYDGKGKDEFRPYRHPDYSIASYWLWYKGGGKPTTPWYCLTKDDYPLVHGLVSKTVNAFAAHQKDEMIMELY